MPNSAASEPSPTRAYEYTAHVGERSIGFGVEKMAQARASAHRYMLEIPLCPYLDNRTQSM